MSQLMKSFGQSIIEITKREKEEEEESRRHAVAKHRAAKTHHQVMRVGDKEGEKAEKTRYKAEKEAEQGRHVRHHRSKYKKSGRSTTTHEAMGSVPGIVSSPLGFSTSRRSKNRAPNAPPTSDLLKKAHDRIAKEKRLRGEKKDRGRKAAKAIAPGVDLDAPKPKVKPSLVARLVKKYKKSRDDYAASMLTALPEPSHTRRVRNAEYTPDNHGETFSEARMGVILRNVKKGTEPYTIVAHKAGRVVDQEHTKMAQAVPAFVREMQKKHRNAKISVEDRRGRVLHIEEVEYVDELSKKLLTRYADKAAAPGSRKITPKRRRGIGLALDKISGKAGHGRTLKQKATAEEVETIEGVAVDKASQSEYKKIMTGQLNQIRRIQRLAKQAADARKKDRGNVQAEANWMVDINNIGKIILDGKSSAEIKVKLRKMLRHKDDIGSVERMTDSAKKKFFRQKATGKEEETNEEIDTNSPKVTPAQEREHQQEVSKALLAQLKKKYKAAEFMSKRKKSNKR